jgi:hypothetical protein
MCPRCERRFSPAVRETPYFAKCPDCSEPVRVPAAAEVEDEWERARESQGYPDTYRLALPPGFERSPDDVNYSPQLPAPKTSAKARDPKPERRERAKPPQAEEQEPAEKETVPQPPQPKVSCPACGAKFAMPPSDKPQVVLCPECLEDVHLPASGGLVLPIPSETTPKDQAKRKEAVASVNSEGEEFETDFIHFEEYPADQEETSKPVDKRKKKRKKPRETAAATAPAENPTRNEKPAKSVFDTMAEIRQEEEDPPPEWTFFSGVTDFLIRPEVAVRWVYSSIGVCAMGWLIFVCLYFYGEFVLAMVCLALPMLFVSVMTLSYLSANGMAILLETAGGNDKINGWPDPDIGDQLSNLVYLAFILAVVLVLSFFLGGFLGLFLGSAWTVILSVAFLLYPIILLSTLEANSPFVPFSLPILKSLKNVNWAWGVFYALSGGLLLVWLWPLLWARTQSGWTQFIVMIFLAPLIAGWCLLYGRLLGRLAWRASLEFPEDEEQPEEKNADEKPKRPKRKKKPRPAESSGELQSAR